MHTLDHSLFEAINAGLSTPAFLIVFARWVSVTLPALVGAGLALWLALGSKAQRIAICKVLAAMATTWIAVHLLRWAVHAPRPAQLGMGVQWLEHAARSGFPSMHAAQAFALAASLALSRMPQLATLAAVGAVAIAWSRVFLGVHFPLDVLAGACTGMLGAGGAHWLWVQTPLSWQRRFSAYWFPQAPP